MSILALHRRVEVDDDLPMKEGYAAFIRDLLTSVRLEGEEEDAG